MAGHGEFEPVETEFAQLLPGVADGRWRMTTGLFATDERRRLASFSRPIWALSDGLLVREGNPLKLTGYRSAADSDGCLLAVVRDQVQHRSAVERGMPDDRIRVFDTYADAAQAVLDGRAHAYASVARAHSGFLESEEGQGLEAVTVEANEKELAFGAFAFNKSDTELLQAIDDALAAYLGSHDHRAMMKRFGFSDVEINPVAT